MSWRENSLLIMLNGFAFGNTIVDVITSQPPGFQTIIAMFVTGVVLIVRGP